ncbi:MAG: DUF4102 domain-containing protein [Nostoc sp.]|uniref:DUF4102 domain-containing protein n=1 Tax=Nostoc sp. TaxID=1180 RepID=UPI002FF85EF1
MKHNSDVPGQLALFAIAPTEIRTTVHDPYWDEVVAPEHPQPEERWNPADFGEVPHKLENDGQLSIFYDDSQEPPDPDDYKNLDDYHRAWAEWEILVRAQVTSSTKKVAPEHNTHWVEKYWVNRNNNRYWYFRYCWMLGRKKKRIHLGSVDSIIAKRKKADVEVWIGDGLAPVEIEKLIRQQRSPQSPMPNI